MPYAYLVALHRLGSVYHSGQWSKGYRLMCLADTYSRRWYGIAPAWPSHFGGESNVRFRRAVAYWLRHLRHHRHTL